MRVNGIGHQSNQTPCATPSDKGTPHLNLSLRKKGPSLHFYFCKRENLEYSELPEPLERAAHFRHFQLVAATELFEPDALEPGAFQ